MKLGGRYLSAVAMVVVSTTARATDRLDPRVRHLIDQMAHAYAAISNVSCILETHIGDDVADSHFTYAGKRRLRFDVMWRTSVGRDHAEPVTLICDGKVYSFRNHWTGHSFLTEGAACPEFYRDSPAGNEALCFIDYWERFDLWEGMPMGTSSFRILSHQPWHGRSWTVLEDNSASDKAIRKYYIDPRTHLMWRTVTTPMLGSILSRSDSWIRSMTKRAQIDISLFRHDRKASVSAAKGEPTGHHSISGRSKAEALLAQMRVAYSRINHASFGSFQTNGTWRTVSRFWYQSPSKVRTRITNLSSQLMTGKLPCYRLTDGKTIFTSMWSPDGYIAKPFTYGKMGDWFSQGLEALSFSEWNYQLSSTSGMGMDGSTFQVFDHQYWNGRWWTVLEEVSSKKACINDYFIDPQSFLIWRTIERTQKSPTQIEDTFRILWLDTSRKIDESLITMPKVYDADSG